MEQRIGMNEDQEETVKNNNSNLVILIPDVLLWYAW